MKTLLVIGLGGGLGSMLRYLSTLLVSNRFPATAFPYGTFAVNIVGCLIIGIVYGLAERYDFMTPQWRLFLATGLCGGYTTFSAFAFENVNLLQNGHLLTAFAYITLSVLLCVAASFLGVWVAKSF